MMLIVLVLGKGVRKGEELKAPRYASAAVTRDYITTRDIIPNNLHATPTNRTRLAAAVYPSIRRFTYILRQ